MRTLIRDVIFPAAGPISLFVSLACAPAGAQIERPTTNTAGAADQTAGLEQRCDRINRIGKFTVTRCD